MVDGRGADVHLHRFVRRSHDPRLLIEPIKADLSLNDTQIGLVQGMAFGLFYATMGCRWAGSRIALRVAV